MSVSQGLLITTDDYRLLPESSPRCQLVEGELFMSPAPNRYHQKISGNLEFILKKYLEKNPIGELYDAPFDVFLTEHNVFQPDKVFISKSRSGILTDLGAEGAPDFVVEILSESTAHVDKELKRKVYANSGVEELWLINPEEKMIEVYYLQKNPTTVAATYGERDVLTSPIFPNLEVNAAEIFQR